MHHRDPFRFWQLQPDGNRAFLAYEHILGYSQGYLTQFERIHELWLKSSGLATVGDEAAVFQAKREAMQQVVRDIHFLLISLQVVWKSLQRLCDASIYPNFATLTTLKSKWEPYFEQYREPRNTFEHYDDQIFGPDSRNNSPGYGVKLQPDGAFALGSHNPVFVSTQSREQFVAFTHEFEAAITSVVGAAA